MGWARCLGVGWSGMLGDAAGRSAAPTTLGAPLPPPSTHPPLYKQGALLDLVQYVLQAHPRPACLPSPSTCSSLQVVLLDPVQCRRFGTCARSIRTFTHPPSHPYHQVVLLDPVQYPGALKVFAREVCKNDLLNFGRLHFFFPDSRLALDLSTDRTLKVRCSGWGWESTRGRGVVWW